MGEAFGIGNMCTLMADSCKCVAKPIQYFKVKVIIIIKINKSKVLQVEKLYKCGDILEVE